MSDANPTTRYERQDVPATAIAAALAGLLLALAVIAWVVALYQKILPGGGRAPAPRPISGEALANLEDSRYWAISGEGRRLARELERRLADYGWVDRERGVVFIPVERAAELELGDGLEVRTVEPGGAP